MAGDELPIELGADERLIGSGGGGIGADPLLSSGRRMTLSWLGFVKLTTDESRSVGGVDSAGLTAE